MRVFFEFNDGSGAISQLFPADYSREQIKGVIHLLKEEKQALVDKIANYQDLIGEVIS
jgi:hypothetical protein